MVSGHFCNHTWQVAVYGSQNAVYRLCVKVPSWTTSISSRFSNCTATAAFRARGASPRDTEPGNIVLLVAGNHVYCSNWLPDPSSLLPSILLILHIGNCCFLHLAQVAHLHDGSMKQKTNLVLLAARPRYFYQQGCPNFSCHSASPSFFRAPLSDGVLYTILCHSATFSCHSAK
jgi:hypothetical protein